MKRRHWICWVLVLVMAKPPTPAVAQMPVVLSAPVSAQAISHNLQVWFLIFLFSTRDTILRHVAGDSVARLSPAQIAHLTLDGAMSVLNEPTNWLGLGGTVLSANALHRPTQWLLRSLDRAPGAQFFQAALPIFSMAVGWQLIRQLWMEARGDLTSGEDFARTNEAWPLLAALVQNAERRTREQAKDYQALEHMVTNMVTILLRDDSLRRRWLINAAETHNALSDFTTAVGAIAAASAFAFCLGPYLKTFTAPAALSVAAVTIYLLPDAAKAAPALGLLAARRAWHRRHLMACLQDAGRAARTGQPQILRQKLARCRPSREDLASVSLETLFVLNQRIKDLSHEQIHRPDRADQVQAGVDNVQRRMWQALEEMLAAYREEERWVRDFLNADLSPRIRATLLTEVECLHRVQSKLQNEVLPLYAHFPQYGISDNAEADLQREHFYLDGIKEQPWLQDAACMVP